MNFKFFSQNENDYSLVLEPMQQLTLLGPRRHTNNEYCFQFDDEEPFVFGMGDEPLTLTINATMNGGITFQNNGRSFKLFARERQ
jgi:hypothetical protein